MFTNNDPGDGRLNRLIFAADLSGGFGLRVKRIEMAGAAVVEEEDAGADWRASGSI
jgi:hypothetical protein